MSLPVPPSPPTPMVRIKAGLRGLLMQTALLERVETQVEEFFEAHPEEVRNERNVRLVTILVLEQLTDTPDAAELPAQKGHA